MDCNEKRKQMLNSSSNVNQALKTHQWWSIRLIQRLQILQWCALGGRNVSHRVHTVQSSFSKPFLSAWMSEKSNRVVGRGTWPGSRNTAFRWAITRRKTIVLNAITLSGPHMLKRVELIILLIFIFTDLLWKKTRIIVKLTNLQSETRWSIAWRHNRHRRLPHMWILNILCRKDP